MRLRTTAPPKAFLMLNPKRLIGCPLARTNTVKWELERRLPARYTRSNSLFRTSLASRGNFWPTAGPPSSLWRKAMAALLAARRQHFAATLGLHTRAKPVCLGAAAFPRLICTLWQSIPPCFFVESSSARENLMLQRSGGCLPPVHTHCRVGFGVFSVKPGCHSSGTIRNYLVYLPPAHRVKKTRGHLCPEGNLLRRWLQLMRDDRGSSANFSAYHLRSPSCTGSKENANTIRMMGRVSFHECSVPTFVTML